MSVEDFVNSMLEDTSVGEILPSMAEEIIAKIEKAASSGKKAKGEGNKMLDSLKRAHEGDESETKRLKLDPKLVDAYGIYAKHKNDALKDVLKWNRQMVGGTRNYLFVKVVDGHVRGRLARCAVCQGGRLKLQEDGQTVTCNGNFDEDSHMRIDCAFKCPVADAPRLQPWYVVTLILELLSRLMHRYSVEPSEEEKEAMEKLDEEVKGGAGPMASDDSIEDKMKEEASNIEWKLVSKQGIRAATAGMVSLLRKYDVDVPSDEIQAKQKVGPVIAANRAKSAAEIIPIAIETFGFIEDKKAKAEKKAAAVTAMVKVQSNAALAAAFQELAELYFKEGNDLVPRYSQLSHFVLHERKSQRRRDLQQAGECRARSGFRNHRRHCPWSRERQNQSCRSRKEFSRENARVLSERQNSEIGRQTSRDSLEYGTYSR